MRWCFVFYVCSFHLSHSPNWAIFILARYGRFSIFRFCVSVRKYFTDLWTQQLSINMLQNCTEHVILVDKQLSFYSTFWFDPIFMPKLANIWQKRLPQGSIFNFRRFSLVFLSFINRSPWKLVKMCILISLINHICATFWSDPTYMPKQANIWQKTLQRGLIFADFCLFPFYLLTDVPEY